MPVYLVTFKSGAQQLVEMGFEDAEALGDQMAAYARWEDQGRPSPSVSPTWTTRPERVFEADTGTVLDVSAIAGFQHYLTTEYAERRFNEDNEQEQD